MRCVFDGSVHVIYDIDEILLAQLVLDKTEGHTRQLKEDVDRLFSESQALIYKNETKLADISKLQEYKWKVSHLSDKTNKVSHHQSTIINLISSDCL